MNKEKLYYFIREGKLRKRHIDIPRVKSLIESARNNVKAVCKIPLNEETATVIFREYYESIRQLGDARWWSLGYEPRASHEVSMEILMEMKINNVAELKKLDRFRKIRNNANYRGYKINIEQAEEIMKFWENYAEKIIKEIIETTG